MKVGFKMMWNSIPQSAEGAHYDPRPPGLGMEETLRRRKKGSSMGQIAKNILLGKVLTAVGSQHRTIDLGTKLLAVSLQCPRGRGDRKREQSVS